MDRLSSCYFCGAALDATLEEHPVVPSALRPGTDTQKTVVLCRTCQRKLGAVLDTVVDAVDANAADVTAGPESGDSTAAGDSATGGDAPEGDIESTLGDDEEILTPLGDEESTDEEAAEASEMKFGDDRAADDETGTGGDDDGDSPSKARKYTRSRGAGFRKEDDGSSETGSLTGGAFDEDDDEDDADAGSLTGEAFSGGEEAPSADADSPTAESTDDPLADGSAGGSTESSSGESDGDAEAAEESNGSSGDGSGSDESGSEHRVSMSRLENTKVMRLLENREFPVDKAEFVTVAANAYQVSQSDCEKVIDLAVEHDLLREENGQLYGGDA